MNSFQVKGMSPSVVFSKTVYLDRQFIIAAPEMPVTPEIISALGEWGFTEVFCEGEPVTAVSAGTQTEQESRPENRSAQDYLEKKQKVEKLYASLAQFAGKLFSEAAEKNKIRFDPVIEQIRNIYGFIRENRRFIMQDVPYTPAAGENYTAYHAARCAVIAINTGIYLNLPQYQRIELGVAGLVHDIGLIALPPQCYSSERNLTESERKLMQTHTLQGYNILKSSNFPPVITAAVLDHHEREDGSGYPRKLTGNKINLYAKIIAVSSEYEELSAKRPNREAEDGYKGTAELLKNSRTIFDRAVTLALTNSLSKYPPGTYVLLSDGNAGRVIGVNPENLHYPFVEVFSGTTLGGKNIAMRTSEDGLSIVSTVDPKEVGIQ